MQQATKPGDRGDRITYAKWMSFGMEFCGVLAIFSYMGHKLDQWLGTSPWLLIAGFSVGFGGMLYTIAKELRRAGGK